jgi:uncharacterized membrane protein
MLSVSKYKKVTNTFILLLISIKLLALVSYKINFIFFIIWVFPFIVFYFFAKINSVKSYQSFCFILLIYFLSASLRVFGIVPQILDLSEIILIILFFIHCLYGPRTLRNM